MIGNIDGRTADGTKLYYVVLDNTGTNILYANKTNALYRFVTPQGFDAVAGTGNFNLKDETIIRSIASPPWVTPWTTTI